MAAVGLVSCHCSKSSFGNEFVIWPLSMLLALEEVFQIGLASFGRVTTSDLSRKKRESLADTVGRLTSQSQQWLLL